MKKSKIVILLFLMLSMFACQSKIAMPKQQAYFRIDLPEAEYQKNQSIPYFTFQNNKCAEIDTIHDVFEDKYDAWYNVYYPELNARIHLSYKAITPKLFRTVSEESRTLAYKHTIRADAIQEQYYENVDQDVYGILYEMKGPAASPVQFFVSDSCHHFLRASLYFQAVPNADSIAPVARYIEQDMIKMIETLNWKNVK